LASGNSSEWFKMEKTYICSIKEFNKKVSKYLKNVSNPTVYFNANRMSNEVCYKSEKTNVVVRIKPNYIKEDGNIILESNVQIILTTSTEDIDNLIAKGLEKIFKKSSWKFWQEITLFENQQSLKTPSNYIIHA